MLCYLLAKGRQPERHGEKQYVRGCDWTLQTYIKKEQEKTGLGSNNVSRLHFSRESTGSRVRAPASLWSGPSAC